MKISRLLFFILLPIILESIIFTVTYFNKNCKNNIRWKKKFMPISLFIDYAIELIFLISVHSITGDFLLSNSINSQISLTAYNEFKIYIITIFLLIIFISSQTKEDYFENFFIKLPYIQFFIIAITFLVFNFASIKLLTKKMDEEIFNNMKYEVEESVFDLSALEDNFTINGNIEGKGNRRKSYIQGSLDEDYNLSYAYVAQNGETVINTIKYTNENINIYENCKNDRPYVSIKKYNKKYKDLTHEYYEYDFHIPSTENTVKIDLN